MCVALTSACLIHKKRRGGGRETEEYHKADPDPFDDRHPGMAGQLF